MFDLNLPVFPFDSTAVTMTTTVWIGVCVAVFFNLRLGWTLSALVVPGYLVPLAMTRPITAAVIVLESVLTYWLVLIISERPRQSAYWSSFFGRDRFFVILLVSVLVRAVFDGWLLPFVGKIAVEQYQINFDYRNELHSFGLIVVALIANYFWKPGLVRGFMPLMTCVGLTWLIVQFVLIPFTNFNVGNFHLLYEDISTSLLASPKSYIILLMTAYLASWFNLRYSWDFNGILIPALLALMWYDPSKIFLSAFECVVILILASLLLKTPLFRNVTMEGAPKLCFFFTICFIYRLTLSHIIPIAFPAIELSDTFGLGYLLTTLMAIKAHAKRFTVRMFRCTAEVSALGAIAGSLIGFALFLGPEIRFGDSFAGSVVHIDQEATSLGFSALPLGELVNADKILLYEKKAPGSYLPPGAAELNTFRNSIESLKELCQSGFENLDRSRLSNLANQFEKINYELVVVQNRYLYLRESSPANGWGMYAIDIQQPSGICIEVPTPMDEPGTLKSGVSLFHQLPSTSMAIAGASRRNDESGASDVTVAQGTIFKEFHRCFARDADATCLQVRGNSDQSYRELFSDPSQKPESEFSSRLWIRDSISPHLNLQQLKELTGSFKVIWEETPEKNRLRSETHGFFAELVLDESAQRNLIGKLFVEPMNVMVESSNEKDSEDSKFAVEVEHVNFRKWMEEAKSNICQQGANGYQRARLNEMLYMDYEVVGPLFALLNDLPDHHQANVNEPIWMDEEVMGRMIPIQASAQSLGYCLKIIVDPLTSEPYVVLVESGSAGDSSRKSSLRGWGTFAFRPGLVDSLAVEIPRPLFEKRSFDFGVSLFERPRASAILVAGAHPRANLDGSADISKAANKTNLYNLVRHVLLREMGRRPYLIAQARAIQAPVEADIVLATDDGTSVYNQLTPLKKQLIDQLVDDKLSYTFVNGRQQTSGYELAILMQATSVQVAMHKEVVSLWLSPSLRSKYREQSENKSLTAQFEACQLKTIESELVDYLVTRSNRTITEKTPLAVTSLPDELKRELKHYVDTSDVVKLMQIVKQFDDWNLMRFVDDRSGQAYLLVSKSENDFPAVLNLTGHTGDGSVKIFLKANASADAGVIDSYIQSRMLWLEPVVDSSGSVSVEKEKLHSPIVSELGAVQ